jgi:hypothetical protein
MAFLVVLTFDLDKKSQDSCKYDDLNKGLAEIGLKKELLSNSGKVAPLPSNTYSGKFEGTGAAKVRDDIIEQIKKVFLANNAQGRFFLAVGGNSWAWVVHTL